MTIKPKVRILRNGGLHHGSDYRIHEVPSQLHPAQPLSPNSRCQWTDRSRKTDWNNERRKVLNEKETLVLLLFSVLLLNKAGSECLKLVLGLKKRKERGALLFLWGPDLLTRVSRQSTMLGRSTTKKFSHTISDILSLGNLNVGTLPQ